MPAMTLVLPLRKLVRRFGRKGGGATSEKEDAGSKPVHHSVWVGGDAAAEGCPYHFVRSMNRNVIVPSRMTASSGTERGQDDRF